MGLAGGVAKHRRARGGDGGGQCVLGRGDAWLIEKHVGALELLGAEVERVAHVVRRPELLERQEVRIDAAPPDDVPTGRGQRHFAASGEQWAGEENRSPDLRRESAIDCRGADRFRVQLERIGRAPFRRHVERAHEVEQRLDVADAWDVVQRDGLIGDQGRANDRQRGIFVSGGANRAFEGRSPSTTNWTAAIAYSRLKR